MTTHFNTTAPSLKPIAPEFRKFKLLEPVSYEVSKGDIIIVPEGFITDFASVPRVLWTFFPPLGRYAPAALIHDYLYATQTRSRKASDVIFSEAMKALGVNRGHRFLIYWGVRGGGYNAWLIRKKEALSRSIILKKNKGIKNGS